MEDLFDLQRFVLAQSKDYKSAVAELRAGSKIGHWMWYIFPQIAGLGYSSMSLRFAIRSLSEAEAYIAHPILGERLKQCTQILLDLHQSNADEIFGPIDALKFRSSMTIFSKCTMRSALFQGALDYFFNGKPDVKTLKILRH